MSIVSLDDFLSSNVFCESLSVMTWLAESLPVGFIPEQRLIALVWCDVVNHVGSSEGAIIKASDTQWMLLEVDCSSLAPPYTITSL